MMPAPILRFMGILFLRYLSTLIILKAFSLGIWVLVEIRGRWSDERTEQNVKPRDR